MLGWGLLALAALPLLAACGGGPPEQEDGPAAAGASPCTVADGVPAPAALVDRLDLGDLVTWEQVQAGDAAVNAAGTATDTDLDTVLGTVQDAAAEAGWEAFSLDDEGFEAELLARDGAEALLGVTLREQACPGQVLVVVSITDYSTLS